MFLFFFQHTMPKSNTPTKQVKIQVSSPVVSNTDQQRLQTLDLLTVSFTTSSTEKQQKTKCSYSNVSYWLQQGAGNVSAQAGCCLRDFALVVIDSTMKSKSYQRVFEFNVKQSAHCENVLAKPKKERLKHKENHCDPNASILIWDQFETSCLSYRVARSAVSCERLEIQILTIWCCSYCTAKILRSHQQHVKTVTLAQNTYLIIALSYMIISHTE